MAVVVGGLFFSVSLIHVPSTWDALNNFDPPKRLVWAVMALILAGVWRVRICRLNRTPLALSFGVLIWIILRTFLKPHPEVDLEVLFTWILPVLLFILAASLDQLRCIRVIGWCLVLAGLIQASIMVLQRFGFDPFFIDTTSVMAYRPGRMVGTIGYQNQAVDFLALSATGIAIVSRSFFLRMVVMLAMLLVAGLTGNRGGIVAYTLAFLISQVLPVWFQESRNFRSRRKIVATLALISVCCASALMLIPETGNRFREIFTDRNHSQAIGSRVLMARIGVGMFQDRPWVGWGAGAFAFQYLDRLGAVLPDKKTHKDLRNVVFARETHNDYLQFAVEFGIVGLLLGGALLTYAAMRCFRNIKEPSGSAMIFILVYMAVSALFSFPWQTSMGGPMAGFLLGLLWQTSPEAERGYTVTNRPLLAFTGRVAKIFLVAVSLVLLGWFHQDAYLNLAVPHTLASNDPAAAERLLPSYAYRYQALVGASFAKNGLDAKAEYELISAQGGYRDIPLLNNLGHVQAKTLKWGEAAGAYEKWAKSGLDHSAALMNLSIAYEQMGQFREAAETLVRRNNLWGAPSPPEIKRLAVIQLKSGDPRSAQETLSRYRRNWIFADTKTVAEIVNLEGSLWLVLGDKQEAEKSFREALDKNPDLESAKRNLAGLINAKPGVK